MLWIPFANCGLTTYIERMLGPAPTATEARAGWVYLVGAGPGAPELLTLRAQELLASADAVLHDELIDAAVLQHCAATCDVRAVGKRGHDRGTKQARQEAIIGQLIELARDGRRVVRLKGGDPFLFGRGAEEAMALVQANIPFEVVPGVCAPVGATAYAGIPLTHRRLASSVTFVTAVTRDGATYDWGQLRGLKSGTLCVFMGTHYLDRIARGLMIDAGRAPDTPVALVEWISYPRQRTVTGTLGDIAERAVEAQIGTPALLIIGEVTTLREHISWYDRQPLFGRRVLVPRPAHQIAPTARLLRQRGAAPVAFPLIAIEAPPDPPRVTRAIAELGSYDLVVFTSANGVSWLWRELARQQRDARAFGKAQVAAIGPATAQQLAQHGVRADIVAETFVAESLAATILQTLGEVTGKRALLPRALVARDVLPNLLREAGMTVDVVPMYQTVDASGRAAELRGVLNDVDVVLLTSSSMAEKLAALVDDVAALPLVASIGPITTRTARELGMTVAVTATQSTSEGLIDALEQHLKGVE